MIVERIMFFENVNFFNPTKLFMVFAVAAISSSDFYLEMAVAVESPRGAT